MLILPKITVLAPNGFSLKIAPKTTFNTKSFEIRPIGATCTSIRPVYNGWLVDSETNFLKLGATTTDGSGEPVLAIGLVAILVTSGGAVASGSWRNAITVLDAVLRVGEVAVFVGSGDGRARWRQR